MIFNKCYLPGVGRFCGPPMDGQYELAQIYVRNIMANDNLLNRIARVRHMREWTPAALRKMKEQAKTVGKS